MVGVIITGVEVGDAAGAAVPGTTVTEHTGTIATTAAIVGIIAATTGIRLHKFG